MVFLSAGGALRYLGTCGRNLALNHDESCESTYIPVVGSLAVFPNTGELEYSEDTNYSYSTGL